MAKKFRCTVCGYIYEGDEAPEQCPLCKASKDKFVEVVEQEGDLTFVTEHKLGDGYEDWEGFYEFHKLGYDELEHFDYEAYKANGFQLPNPGNAPLGPEPLGHAY